MWGERKIYSDFPHALIYFLSALQSTLKPPGFLSSGTVSWLCGQVWIRPALPQLALLPR